MTRSMRACKQRKKEGRNSSCLSHHHLGQIKVALNLPTSARAIGQSLIAYWTGSLLWSRADRRYTFTPDLIDTDLLLISSVSVLLCASVLPQNRSVLLSQVGVVGRTGSGKSSLMLTLFRVLELERGSITIDGVDIARCGLKQLRQSIAMLPQDPTIFSGSIKQNLVRG